FPNRSSLCLPARHFSSHASCALNFVRRPASAGRAGTAAVQSHFRHLSFSRRTEAPKDIRTGGGQSTIHYQCFSGDECGVVAGQEQRGACDVLGFSVLGPRLELVEALGGGSGVSSIG